jgi:hypothetical protein
MIYKTYFSDWKIEVIEDEKNDGSSYDAVFRATTREDRDCEQFSLIDKTSDTPYLQVRIFDTDEVAIESYAPTFVRVSDAKKLVTVSFADSLLPA